MKLNKKYEASVCGTVGLVASVIAITAASTWAILKASEWNVSAAIATKLSNEAALDASEQQELSDLRTKVDEQKASYEKELTDDEMADADSVDQLKMRLSSLADKNRKLTDALAALTADTTSLKVPTGEARFIADKRVAVGVEAVTDTFATVRIGDYSSINMYPGESRSVQYGDKSFVVTLMKVEAAGCVFAVRNG